MFIKHSNRLVAAALLPLLLAVGCQSGAQSAAPDRIRVGYAISLTGPYAPGAQLTQVNNYKLGATGGRNLRKDASRPEPSS